VPSRIDVVGLFGGAPVGADAGAALASADLVVGGREQLAGLSGDRPNVTLKGDLAPALDAIAAEPGWVCVLASGDPGFFGIVRVLAQRFGPDALVVHPAPSSVALAFARAGLPWDDATVVSVHGRPMVDAARMVAMAATVQKVAVLTSPEAPPEALGRQLLAIGALPRRVLVCSRLAEPGESVTETDLAGLAAGTWEHRSVVLLIGEREIALSASQHWPGLDVAAFDARDGMITKPEVRAVAISKLDLPATGVMWDVGAGSGSVAIECAACSPGLRVVAVERWAADCDRIRDNAIRHRVDIDVVEGEAPVALASLPEPDRAFVGGGGLEVLDAVLGRLAPGGTVVATYARLDRAAAAHDRLGNLIELHVSRSRNVGDGVRLAAENPVFVAWGAR
jgi:precorrin-6Y C5,15-methyltransferase (decarboxylating)